MFGPTTFPDSTSSFICFSRAVSPPRSRTVVIPRPTSIGRASIPSTVVCACISMKPGVIHFPVASMRSAVASRFAPTSRIVSPSTRMSTRFRIILSTLTSRRQRIISI